MGLERGSIDNHRHRPGRRDRRAGRGAEQANLRAAGRKQKAPGATKACQVSADWHGRLYASTLCAFHQ